MSLGSTMGKSFDRELVAAYDREERARAIVREIWPWLSDKAAKMIAAILVAEFNRL